MKPIFNEIFYVYEIIVEVGRGNFRSGELDI